MKRPFILYFLLGAILACVTISCENLPTDDDNNTESIYWNKSTAFRVNLKGNVKTLVDDTTTIYEFNESGNVTSHRNQWDEQSYQEKTYNYVNGVLTTMILTYNNGSSVEIDTTTYTYGSHGKFLPVQTFHLTESGLVKNLSTIVSGNSLYEYVVSGDSMLMISTYTYTDSEPIVDTTNLRFNGDFPVNISGEMHYSRLTYAPDGRFLTAVEGNVGHMDYSNYTSRIFDPANLAMLLTSIVFTNINMGVESSSEGNYTYNDHDDQIGFIEGTYQEEYSDYVYDAQGNWTERKYRYLNGPSWSSKVTQTRQIIYWDQSTFSD